MYLRFKCSVRNHQLWLFETVCCLMKVTTNTGFIVYSYNGEPRYIDGKFHMVTSSWRTRNYRAFSSSQYKQILRLVCLNFLPEKIYNCQGKSANSPIYNERWIEYLPYHVYFLSWSGMRRRFYLKYFQLI